MAMEKLLKPDEHEFLSPLVCFENFKKKALEARNKLAKVIKSKPHVEFPNSDDMAHSSSDDDDVVSKKKKDIDELVAQNLVKTFGISKIDAKEQTESMNVSALAEMNKCDVFFRKNVEFLDIPCETKLETIRIRKKLLEYFMPLKAKPFNRKRNPWRNLTQEQTRQKIAEKFSKSIATYKYSHYFENELKQTREMGFESSVNDDIVVTLTICKPHNGPPELQGRHSFPLRPYWKYKLCGETLLTDMHALFKCSADFGATPETSEHIPDVHDFNFFKYPSSFIFIYDTFYIADVYHGMEASLSQIDLQKLKPLIDISEPIREWMKRKKADFGPTQVKSFKDVKIKDLTCRLGFPYVYVHQGHCEHIFFFTDLSLMNAKDNMNDYPLQVSNTSLSRKCCACRNSEANWIVEGEDIPLTPVFMCDTCYHEFYFDRQHRRNINLQAYIYFDPSVIQYS